MELKRIDFTDQQKTPITSQSILNLKPGSHRGNAEKLQIVWGKVESPVIIVSVEKIFVVFDDAIVFKSSTQYVYLCYVEQCNKFQH